MLISGYFIYNLFLIFQKGNKIKEKHHQVYNQGVYENKMCLFDCFDESGGGESTMSLQNLLWII